jgi:hypothetical protein
LASSNKVTVMLGGNTTGASAFVAQNLVLYGGSNMTLSGEPGGRVVFVAGGGTGGGGTTNVTNNYYSTVYTGGTTNNYYSTLGPAVAATGGTATGGTVMFSNSNNVSFGYNAGTITASASFSGGAGGGAGTAGAITGGSITVNTSGISINLPAYLTTAQPPGAYLTTQTVQPALGLNTALTANGVSMTANTSGLSLNFPAFLTTANRTSSRLSTARRPRRAGRLYSLDRAVSPW